MLYAFAARRCVPTGAASRIAEAHRDNGNEVFVIEFPFRDPHPVAQAPTRIVIERNAGLVRFRPGGLARNQQSCRRRDLEQRLRSQRQVVRAQATVSDFAYQGLKRFNVHGGRQTSEEPTAAAMRMAGIIPNAVAIAKERVPMGVSAYPAETRKWGARSVTMS